MSAPANRGVAPGAALGLSLDFTAYHAGGGPPVYTALSVAAAADVIDGLAGQELAAAPGALGSWWRDLWDAVKSGAAQVVHFAVSVGRDIYLGLKYIVQGAEYVLRQALHTIEEVAVAIGSVLAAIGRIVADVIEGLSLIFHLDKVLAVANMIKEAYGTMTANLVTLIANAAPTIDNLFATAEAKIDSAFGSIISSLEGTPLQYHAAGAQTPGRHQQHRRAQRDGRHAQHHLCRRAQGDHPNFVAGRARHVGRPQAAPEISPRLRAPRQPRQQQPADHVPRRTLARAC